MSSENNSPNTEKSGIGTLGTVLISLLTALVTSFATSRFTLKNEIELNRQDFKQSALKEIISNDDVGNARKKIKFLLDAGMIGDEEAKIHNALSGFKFETEATENLLKGKLIFDKAFIDRLKGNIKKQVFFEEALKAIVLFTKTIDLEPENHVALRERGFVYQKLGYESKLEDEVSGEFFYTKSVDDLSIALKLNENPHYYYLRGIAYLNLKKYTEALKEFEKANSSLEGGSSECLLYISIAKVLQDKFEEAEESLRKAINLSFIQGTSKILIEELNVQFNIKERNKICNLIQIAKEAYGNKITIKECI